VLKSQFPTSVPTASVVLNNLNQPFLPTLSLSATELLGIPEPMPIPTGAGFAAAFPDDVAKTPDADADAEAGGKKGGSGSITSTSPLNQPMPKTVRDLEMVLNANWREITTESEQFIGKHRDQLENKTGLEVAVLAM
jgi:putative membrane protein